MEAALDPTMPLAVAGQPHRPAWLLTITGATGGTFRLLVHYYPWSVFPTGTPTAAIAYPATAAAVKAALEAIPLLISGTVTVTGDTGGPYTLTWSGTLAAWTAHVEIDGASLTPAATTSAVLTTPALVQQPHEVVNGAYRLVYPEGTTDWLLLSASAATVQSAVRGIPGHENAAVTGSPGALSISLRDVLTTWATEGGPAAVSAPGPFTSFTYGFAGYPASVGDGALEYPDIVVVAGGKHLIAASVTYNGYVDYGVVVFRIGADGAIDPTFGTAGYLAIPPVGATDYYLAGIAVQSDGKVLLLLHTGTIFVGSHALELRRYSADGVLDTAGFGGGTGKVTTPFTAFGLFQNQRLVAVQSDGKIIVGGGVLAEDNYALARYDTAGVLDTSFGTAGIVRHAAKATNDRPSYQAILVQSDDKIVAAPFADGFSDAGNGTVDADLLVLRYTAAGALDPTWGTGGAATILYNSAVGCHRTLGLVLQSDGKVITFGETETETTPNATVYWLLTRFDAAGILDPTFGAAGVVLDQIKPDSYYGEFIRDAAVLLSGKVLAVGSIRNFFAAGAASQDFDNLITRYNADGSRDTDWGEDGRLWPTLASKGELSGVALISGGFLAVGGIWEPGGEFSYGVVWRFTDDGTLSTDLSVLWREAGGRLDAGAVYVAGLEAGWVKG